MQAIEGLLEGRDILNQEAFAHYQNAEP